jgi:hypothetical protein
MSGKAPIDIVKSQNGQSKVFMRLLLAFFLIFQVLYMAFLFDNLKHLELANAIQKECGASPMERETRRYQIYTHYNLADVSLWESSLNFGWVLLVLVMIVTAVFLTQGKIIWTFELAVVSIIAVIFLIINLYILKTRFEFDVTNIFRSLSLSPKEKPCAGMNLFDLGAIGGKSKDNTFCSHTQGLSVYYKDLTNKIRDVVECTPPANEQSTSTTCPFVMDTGLRKAILRRLVAVEKEYLSPDEAEVRLNKMLQERDYYQLMSYLKLEAQEKDLRNFRISEHELQDLTFSDAYEPLKDKIIKLIAISYVPISILVYVFLLHPTFVSYAN